MSASMMIITCRPASRRAHAGCQAWSPGTAIAGSPRERAAIMSGGPSTRRIRSETSAAGWGISPRRLPGYGEHFGAAGVHWLVAQEAA